VILTTLMTVSLAWADSLDTSRRWSLHAQATYIVQGHGPFHSPYSGANSLSARSDAQATITSTLFAGMRVWPGGEIYVNPELDGGAGLSEGFGVAGSPNGEGTRVGTRRIRPYLSRLFFRQVIGLGSETELRESAANQMAGPIAKKRLTFTFGKYSAVDVFDQNTYSHDPRTQFLNWALIDNAAWDYPANSRGYSWGSSLELTLEKWAARAGGFLVPLEANGPDLDKNIAHAHGLVAEIERSVEWRHHPGKWRILGFYNEGFMGDYRTTLVTPAFQEDVTRSRQVGNRKYGYGLNGEQELCEDLGSFLRAGWDDGHTETWAFTEVDRTLSMGLRLNGNRWNRQEDTFGLAGIVNALSREHREYLAAGGLGFIIGDGRLNYGTENIIETYYRWQAFESLALTFDIQGIQNPAYNRDRGPVVVFGGRLHWEF
jgi:high affinity Mn2+ porin